eukprot:2814131-Rhodomonas_salina.1
MAGTCWVPGQVAQARRQSLGYAPCWDQQRPTSGPHVASWPISEPQIAQRMLKEISRGKCTLRRLSCQSTRSSGQERGAADTRSKVRVRAWCGSRARQCVWGCRDGGLMAGLAEL